MSEPSDLLEVDGAPADDVVLDENLIPALAPSVSEVSAEPRAGRMISRAEDPLLPDRYDVPFASTDAPASARTDTSPRGAGRRWKTSLSAAEFYPRVPAGAPIRSEGVAVRNDRTPPRHRVLSLALVTVLLAGLLGAFAVSTVVTFPRLRLGTTVAEDGPQRIPAAATATIVTVPATSTTGRGYVLTVPAGFGAEAPALDGSDVSLVSAGTGTFFGVVSHAGPVRPALLETGNPVRERVAGLVVVGVSATRQGRVTRALEFRHDGVWYVVTESADAPVASTAFATLAKTLQQWHFSPVGA